MILLSLPLFSLSVRCLYVLWHARSAMLFHDIDIPLRPFFARHPRYFFERRRRQRRPIPSLFCRLLHRFRRPFTRH